VLSFNYIIQFILYKIGGEEMERKFIPGTGHAYSCDKEGNIYSHYIKGSHQITVEPQRVLIPYTGANNNYLMVGLSLNGHCYNKLVHRLVALTWLDNPNNYPEIDHKDNNVQNNKLENLQWCTRKMNVEKQEVDKGSLNGLRSHTILYKNDGSLIGEFPSIREASEYASENFGCSKTGMQKYHKSKGYYIVPDNDIRREICAQRIKAEWDLYSPQDVYIGTFKTKKDAARYIKENIRDISVKLFSDKGKAYGYYVIEKSVETN
jgi:hypothetical protein